MDPDRTRSRWAEMPSDEDSSAEEHHEPVPPRKHGYSKNPLSCPEHLHQQIVDLQPPILLRFQNLSFRITSPELILSQFSLLPEESAQIAVTICKVENRPSGHATALVPTTELALKIASFHEREILGRRMLIALDNVSSRRPNQRGGQRGPSRRGRCRNPRNNQPRGPHNFAHQAGESKDTNFFKNNKREGLPHSSSTSAAKPAKVRPNPFGEAKPIDTLAKELEFELKMKTPAENEDGGEEHLPAKKYVRVYNKRTETQQRENAPQHREWGEASNALETHGMPKRHEGASHGGRRKGPRNN